MAANHPRDVKCQSPILRIEKKKMARCSLVKFFLSLEKTSRWKTLDGRSKTGCVKSIVFLQCCRQTVCSLFFSLFTPFSIIWKAMCQKVDIQPTNSAAMKKATSFQKLIAEAFICLASSPSASSSRASASSPPPSPSPSTPTSASSSCPWWTGPTSPSSTSRPPTSACWWTDPWNWSPRKEAWSSLICSVVNFIGVQKQKDWHWGPYTMASCLAFYQGVVWQNKILCPSVHSLQISRRHWHGPRDPCALPPDLRWIPESERSFNASFILAGYGVGTFLSFLTSGMLCASDFLGGWPSVFYIGGLCGFVWCLLCYLFIYERPKDHPTISKKELNYISNHLGNVEQKQIKKIPWRCLLTSVPFWALALGYFGQFWILGFYSTVQTLYMGTILNLDSITNGELSCVPPLARGVFACICGYPADIALKRGYVGKAFIRKGATVINTVFSCAGFVAILLAGCNPLLNTIFFTIGGLLGDFITFGVCMGGVDIAPNLSGTVSGILNFIGVIPFFLIPALVGFSTKYERSMAQWRYVYCGTIGVVVLTTAVYVFFGTSDAQQWGTYDDEPVDEDNVDLTKKEKNEEECE
ncbi:putative sialin [Caerostris extrusa]|uniref:Sialin n=1 Tax=Caerostris extrusa TaxID=172846 RepID=A0AAV4SZA4_CAEEX|nr:putative sialin [Caerostris extrusa]